MQANPYIKQYHTNFFFLIQSLQHKSGAEQQVGNRTGAPLVQGGSPGKPGPEPGQRGVLGAEQRTCDG